jgi:hypothetical protein
MVEVRAISGFDGESHPINHYNQVTGLPSTGDVIEYVVIARMVSRNGLNISNSSRTCAEQSYLYLRLG